MSESSATERLTAQPTARTFRVEELVRLVRAGQMRVPDFQRDFRWGTSDVEDLFDSLLRGFPVGNLLLWQRKDNPAQTVMLGEMTIAAPASDTALWVVDGQQRVTSLVNAVDAGAFERTDRFALVFDLIQGRVVRRGRGTEDMSVPLPVLFDLRRLLSWVQQHPEMVDHIETLNDVATSLRDVAIPASIVADADATVLREIFDRTNNSGKRLSRAEVFSALFGPPTDVGTVLSLESVAEALEAGARFGRVDDDTVLLAMLSCRGPDVARDVRREFPEAHGAPRKTRPEFDDDEQQAYARAQDAMAAAIAFLQQDVGVPHFAFLPYRYLLVVLTRFFAHFPTPHPRNRLLLARWVWITALRGPGVFKGSTTGAARALCSRVHPGHEADSVQDLLTAVDDVHAPPLPDLDRFRTNYAMTRIVLCVLWSLRPRSLDTQEVMDEDELARALEGEGTALAAVFDIIPRHRLSGARSAADRLIAVPDDIESARARLRGEHREPFAPRLSDEVFASHAIDAAARAALAAGDDAAFLAARTVTLTALVSDVIHTRTGQGFERTPPLDTMDLDEPEGPRDDLDPVADHASD